MKIKKIKSKVKLIYQLFVAAPKQWDRPKPSEILLYDLTGLDVLAPYFSKFKIALLSTEGEFVNVPCLLRAASTLRFWKGAMFSTYVQMYLAAVEPKVILTFIDNSIAFYRISKQFPKSKTIFIQNGTRAQYKDVFDQLALLPHAYHVDYLCVHNHDIGKEYLKYLTGEVVLLGSLKNNAFSEVVCVQPLVVVFISQWRANRTNHEPLYRFEDGTEVSWEDFYSIEKQVVSFLDTWCSVNGRFLKICGGTKEIDGPERQYYLDSLKKSKWSYVPKSDSLSSYRLISSAGLVVSIDSTLGYEALARGLKTAFFSCRLTKGHKLRYKFGWPANLPENGPFWTNERDEVQFERVMGYLANTPLKVFQQTLKNYADALMVFDPGNSRLVDLLTHLLVRPSDHQHAN